MKKQRSADWAKARSYKETGDIFEVEIEGFNSGGLLTKFSSLIGFLPYAQLNQAPFCTGNLMINFFYEGSGTILVGTKFEHKTQ